MSVDIKVKLNMTHIAIYFLLLLAVSVGLGCYFGNLLGVILYTIVAYVVSLALSLIPVGGPVILWAVVLPSLASSIGVSNMFVIDILVMVPCIIINAIITMLVIVSILGALSW